MLCTSSQLKFLSNTVNRMYYVASWKKGASIYKTTKVVRCSTTKGRSVSCYILQEPSFPPFHLDSLSLEPGMHCGVLRCNCVAGKHQKLTNFVREFEQIGSAMHTTILRSSYSSAKSNNLVYVFMAPDNLIKLGKPDAKLQQSDWLLQRMRKYGFKTVFPNLFDVSLADTWLSKNQKHNNEKGCRVHRLLR